MSENPECPKMNPECPNPECLKNPERPKMNPECLNPERPKTPNVQKPRTSENEPRMSEPRMSKNPERRVGHWGFRCSGMNPDRPVLDMVFFNGYSPWLNFGCLLMQDACETSASCT